MTPAEVLDILAEANPEALLLEPRLTYDCALVGVTTEPEDGWQRESKAAVAVYSAELCIESLMLVEGASYEDAADWFGFNTASAWAGEGTPTFVYSEAD